MTDAAPADPHAEYQLEFEAWLDSLDTLHAARVLQALTTNPSRLGELRAERVHALTRNSSHDDVAAQLGVGRPAIAKAVYAHNRRVAAAAADAAADRP